MVACACVPISYMEIAERGARAARGEELGLHNYLQATVLNTLVAQRCCAILKAVTAGRPSKYDPKYCKMLEDHLAEGLSYESFGVIADVCDDTLREWEKVHPEFSASKKIGRKKQRVFYEKLGITGAKGEIENFNSTAFVWMTKNMLDWRDKSNVEHSGSVTLESLVSGSIPENKKD